MADETREVLVNPFRAGETVTIPAGTMYTTTDPAHKGRQKMERAMTVVVDEIFPASLVRTRSQQVLVQPLRIRTTCADGYSKDINITEKIIRLNGKIPQYEQVSADV